MLNKMCLLLCGAMLAIDVERIDPPEDEEDDGEWFEGRFVAWQWVDNPETAGNDGPTLPRPTVLDVAQYGPSGRDVIGRRGKFRLSPGSQYLLVPMTQKAIQQSDAVASVSTGDPGGDD